MTNFHKFHGGKAYHIKSYIHTHLKDEHPDSVVIIAGGNDLPTGDYSLFVLTDISDDIIDAGLVCKEYGVKKVFISSILPRSSLYFQLHRKRLNDILREQCKINGFVFIEHRNFILRKHIGRDGVHLNALGSTLLCKNLWYYLNGKD